MHELKPTLYGRDESDERREVPVETARVLCGDMREVLRRMPAESVHAIVSDPPYGLEFMAKAWDQQVPGPEYWREALRVAKPGAHLVAFGGTRTAHRLACAIEDAGWEIRDCLMWLYGSGFPKSHDISKAIEKQRHDDVRPVCRFLRRAMERANQTSKSVAEAFGFHSRMVDHWAARDTDSQPCVPTLAQWIELKHLLQFGDSMDAVVARLNERKGAPGEDFLARDVTGTVQAWRDRSNYAITGSDGLRRDVPVSPDGQRWQGWGTALKPAWEPIYLCRKPFKQSVASNVCEHGCGALNVDGCRIGSAEHLVRPAVQRFDNCALGRGLGAGVQTEPLGRWPANLVLDEEAAALLDAQTGELKSGDWSGHRNMPKTNSVYGSFELRSETPRAGDSGGASRFFYVAKSSRSEREAGLDRFEPRNVNDGRDTSIDNPYQRGDTHRRNTHPTVKPVSLMRWLVRLVTPPGGTVLDPFLGSGTTGVAAVLEGAKFIGIELSPEFAELARARIAHASDEDDGDQLTLFDRGELKPPVKVRPAQASFLWSDEEVTP